MLAFKMWQVTGFTFLHSVSKELQHFWSCLSVGEECIPMNMGLYIISTICRFLMTPGYMTLTLGPRKNPRRKVAFLLRLSVWHASIIRHHRKENMAHFLQLTGAQSDRSCSTCNELFSYVGRFFLKDSWTWMIWSLHNDAVHTHQMSWKCNHKYLSRKLDTEHISNETGISSDHHL